MTSEKFHMMIGAFCREHGTGVVWEEEGDVAVFYLPISDKDRTLAFIADLTLEGHKVWLKQSGDFRYWRLYTSPADPGEIPGQEE